MSSGMILSKALRQLATFKSEPYTRPLHCALTALRSAEGLGDKVVALGRVMIPVPFVDP